MAKVTRVHVNKKGFADVSPSVTGTPAPALPMAAAANDDATALRCARRARATCSWGAMLFMIEDHSDPSRYLGGAERLSTMLLGVFEEDAGAIAYDLVLWPRLEDHVRRELCLTSESKLVISLQHAALSYAIEATNTAVMLSHDVTWNVMERWSGPPHARVLR